MGKERGRGRAERAELEDIPKPEPSEKSGSVDEDDWASPRHLRAAEWSDSSESSSPMRMDHPELEERESSFVCV